jgi:tetratricopeptide (TPR) repeat protein
VVAGVETFRRITADSELSKGLKALNSAFSQQRPVDARISVLDYRVRPNTRGDEPVLADKPMLRQAELTLRAYDERKQSSRSLHALGCLYLAQRDLDKAIDTLNKALALDQNSPQIHSDLGAAYLEKGKSLQRTDSASGEPEFSRSLDHLNRALELDPASLDARFNRALLYQQTQRVDQALNDWQEYLNRDGASPWANEARANIRAIENQK